MNTPLTVVITGAASGIGLALARHAAKQGMNVVLADLDSGPLHAATNELQAHTPVLTVPTDVSDAGQVNALKDHVIDAFDHVDILFNNAGVGAGAGLTETTTQDWAWVMDVNFGGVLNGVRAFLPHMLERNDGHIVNTASMAGILPYHPSAPYQVSKTAIVALTEHLHVTLMQRASRVRTSVLCPGNVATRIMDSDRLRPHAHPSPPAMPLGTMQQMRDTVERQGLSPAFVAHAAFDGVQRGDLYIVTHTDHLEHLERRTSSIVASAAHHAPAASAT